MDWYYVKDGEKQGPVSGTDLRRLANDKQLLPEDHVWRDGMSDWILARKVRGLFGDSRETVDTPTPPDAGSNESVEETAKKIVPKTAPGDAAKHLETPFAPDGAKTPDLVEKPSTPEQGKKAKPGRAVRDIVLPEIISNKSPEAIPTAKVEPSASSSSSPTVKISIGDEKPGRKQAPTVGPVQVNLKGGAPAQEAEPAQPTAPVQQAIPAQPVESLAAVDGTPPEAAPVNIAPPPVLGSVDETLQGGETPAFGVEAQDVSKSTPPRKDVSQPAELTHLFDFLLTGICSVITPPFVDATCRMLLTIGHYGLYAAMLIVFVTGVIFAIQSQVYALIGVGLVLALALLVLQFLGTRFSEALESLVRASHGKIHSTVLLDALAFLFITIGSGILLTAGLGVLAAGSLGGLQGILSVLGGLLFGLTCFVTCLFAAAASLCPESVNVTEESAAESGEQALGLYGFLANLLARTTVVLYGAGVALGTIGLILALAISFTGDASETVEPEQDASMDAFPEYADSSLFMEEEPIEEESESLIAGLGFGAALTTSLYLVLIAACSPAFVYLGLLAIMLQLSVLRAILSMGKRPFEVCLPQETSETVEEGKGDE